LNLRALELRDIETVLAIQSVSPEIAQWTAADYERIARGEMAGWVAEGEAGIVGFLVARALTGETEILNFAVRQDARHRGVGTALLTKALDWSRSVGADRVFLEVRASNEPAIQFYESHGFAPAGRRPRYYSAPPEDALLLSFPLRESSAR